MPHSRDEHSEITFRSLPQSHQDLIRLFQTIRFGKIPCLSVAEGEPVMDRDLQWVRTVKVTGDNQPHPAEERESFVLRREQVRFLRMITELREAELRNLTVVNGLPVAFEINESLAS